MSEVNPANPPTAPSLDSGTVRSANAGSGIGSHVGQRLSSKGFRGEVSRSATAFAGKGVCAHPAVKTMMLSTSGKEIALVDMAVLYPIPLKPWAL